MGTLTRHGEVVVPSLAPAAPIRATDPGLGPPPEVPTAETRGEPDAIAERISTSVGDAFRAQKSAFYRSVNVLLRCAYGDSNGKICQLCAANRCWTYAGSPRDARDARHAASSMAPRGIIRRTKRAAKVIGSLAFVSPEWHPLRGGELAPADVDGKHKLMSSTGALSGIVRELGGLVEASTTDASLSGEEHRRVLRFVARVAHVVEQAVQDVYALSIEIRHVKPGDGEEIDRLRRELDLILVRSAYAKSEEICSRLGNLRDVFEKDVAQLLRCSRGDPRWHDLFFLLDEREGRIIQLVQAAVWELSSRLDSLRSAGFFQRGRAHAAAAESADDVMMELHAALVDLRKIRDAIFGVSGTAGFLELTATDPEGVRHLAHMLNLEITMGDKFENISNATIVNRSLMQDSFNRLKAYHGDAVAQAILKIADAIETSGNGDAAENFESFNEELAKPKPKKSVLRALWDGMLAAAPAIKTMAEAGVIVAKLLT